MNRWKDILNENILLWILIAGAGLIGLLFGWTYSIGLCVDSVRTVDGAYQDFWNDSEVLYDNVVIRNSQGVYLVNEQNKKILSGPYEAISGLDFESGCIARYKSEDGLIGFIYRSGQIAIPAIYTSASDICEYKSTVTDQDGNEFEIDVYDLIIQYKWKHS